MTEFPQLFPQLMILDAILPVAERTFKMTKRSVEDIIEQIKTLSCEELAELILAIEKEFSVSAGCGKRVRSQKEPVLIPPSFKIILTECGSNYAGVVKYIRNYSRNNFNWGLGELIQIVKNNLPQAVCVVYDEMSSAEAEGEAQSIIRHLEELGAKAEWTFDYGNYID